MDKKCPVCGKPDLIVHDDRIRDVFMEHFVDVPCYHHQYKCDACGWKSPRWILRMLRRLGRVTTPEVVYLTELFVGRKIKCDQQSE